MTTTTEASRVVRLRRNAGKQGFQLTKNRYKGGYRLVDVTGNRPDPNRSNMSLDEVARYLGVDM